MLLADAYRRDLDRAVSLLLDYVQSDAYDGVALILKPKSQAHKPAFVVGGFYRHRLTEAADASMQLHLAITLRAREQGPVEQPRDSRNTSQHRPDQERRTLDQRMQQATLQEKWGEVTARYHRCEQMLRITFSKHLCASPETTAILLSITQLNIETVANCLLELLRQPGRAAPQSQLDTLNAIQLFRNLRAQVSTWMPPAGQEEAYFTANAGTLSEEMLVEGNALLCQVEATLKSIADDVPVESVGTSQRLSVYASRTPI